MYKINVFDALDTGEIILRFLTPDQLTKPVITEYKNFLPALLYLLKNRFNPECDVYELLSLNTSIMDVLLNKIWNLYEFPKNTAALVAIGGYGRRELFPQSDIDILIVLNDKVDKKIEEKVKEFLTFLWDINLPIAQSVRSLQECISEAKNDLTVITSMMELHFIAGNKKLFEQVKIGIDNKIWPSKKFFKEKTNELNIRHRKFSSTANLLEPNIKENPGGLRDLHTLYWLTNRHFKTNSFEELISKSFLTRQELEMLKKAYINLAKIRFSLHLHTQRSEDRLLFDYQYDVASLLGFHDENRNRQVEEFMQVYYRTSNQISTLIEILINRLQSIIFPGLLRRRAKKINERFQSRAGKLEAAHPDIFKESPTAIFELFLLLQEHSNLEGPSNGLIQLLLENLHLIDKKFRESEEIGNLFIEILNHPKSNVREIRRMAHLGVLGRYWPSFHAVTGRMQFDLYHIYTVEEHTLHVLENACKFSRPVNDDENSTYHDIFIQTPKALPLYLAALFHDIAKGRGGDHSTLGGEEARQFCLKLNLSEYDANLVAWLVKNHLVMSKTAQHQDLDDPDVVKIFAENIGNLTRLNYLYLLTIADICGTNPKLWNNWRSHLLSKLYQDTSKHLRRGLDSPIKREELINEVKESALKGLNKLGIDKSSCESFWQELENDYFLRHSDEEVIRHTYAILEHKETDNVIVNIHQYSARGATEVFIYCNDRSYLFAHITFTLAKLGLTIVHARIITSKQGHALDTFLVLDIDGNPIDDKSQCELVAKELKDTLTNPTQISTLPPQRLPRRIRELRVPTEIIFEETEEGYHTTLEIKAPDFPGLLASLGSAFVDCNISVHNARISKLGERVHNIFHVSTFNNKPLDDIQKNKLKDVIYEYLHQPKQISLAV